MSQIPYTYSFSEPFYINIYSSLRQSLYSPPPYSYKLSTYNEKDEKKN